MSDEGKVICEKAKNGECFKPKLYIEDSLTPGCGCRHNRSHYPDGRCGYFCPHFGGFQKCVPVSGEEADNGK